MCVVCGCTFHTILQKGGGGGGGFIQKFSIDGQKVM